MIKNKTKAGMILIYTDEYGNQKAIEPKDLKVKLDSETEINLGNFINEAIKMANDHTNRLKKLEKELNSFKENQINNTKDLLDTQTKQTAKLEKLSNEVNTLLSINN